MLPILGHYHLNESHHYSLLIINYLCAHYDTGKTTGYAVPHCRDKEVSLTSKTECKKLVKTNNSP